MALHLLHSDDFTGYANDAAFKAAYPYDPPTNMTSSASSDMTWSATNGPDGQPGVARTGGLGSTKFDVFPLLPQGKQFRVSGRWKFAALTADIGSVMTLWWAESTNRSGGGFAGNIVGITCTTTGSLTINVKTDAANANVGGHVYAQTITGAFTPGTAFDLVVDGAISTITEISPGVFAPSTDGSVTVSVDAVQIFSFSGPVWHNDASLNEYPGYWNGVSIYAGKFTNLEVYDEVATKVGSFVAGYKGSVTASRAALFSLRTGYTNSTEELFVIDGDLEVTGTTTVGTVRHYPPVTVELTDAQIKALPTTPITLLAAQGANTIVDVRRCTVVVKSTGGAYTNLDATDASVWVTVGGVAVTDYIVNYSPDSITALTSMFGSTSVRYAVLLPRRVPSAGYGETVAVAMPGVTLTNAAVEIAAANNGAGNWTGGNAANTLIAVLEYSVIAV